MNAREQQLKEAGCLLVHVGSEGSGERARVPVPLACSNARSLATLPPLDQAELTAVILVALKRLPQRELRRIIDSTSALARFNDEAQEARPAKTRGPRGARKVASRAENVVSPPGDPGPDGGQRVWASRRDDVERRSACGEGT